MTVNDSPYLKMYAICQQLNHLDKYVVSTTLNVLEHKHYLQLVRHDLQHVDKSNNRSNVSDQFKSKHKNRISYSS